jgi:histidine triad (HIT) family protein
MAEEQIPPEQAAELQKQNCLFCQLGSGKIPSKKVYEDEKCFAILDINPATKGHILLMPKEHFVVLPQAPDDSVRHLGIIARKLSKSLLRVLGAQGTNIFIANGVAAGQRAPHLIIHIIPRSEGDSITAFEIPEKSIAESDLLLMQQKFAQRLGTRLEAPKEARKEETKQQSKKLEEIDLQQLKKLLQ